VNCISLLQALLLKAFNNNQSINQSIKSVTVNNDGCVVARSREAKLLGIKMGVPVFQIKAEMQRHGVFWHSRPITRCTQI